MFKFHNVIKENDEEVLVLYLDQFNMEVGELGAFDSKSKTLRDNIDTYLKKNKVGFKGGIIKIALGGVIISQLIIPKSVASASENNDESYIEEYLSDPSIIYVVKANDTLYSIALRFETTVEELMRLNNLGSSKIFPGQQLVLKSDVYSYTIRYEVKSGDTLSSIAAEFNVTIQSIMEENNLKSTKIKRNQVLNITKYTDNDIVLHQVLDGETLYSIAGIYNVSVDSIKSLNGLISNLIHPNQILKISLTNSMTDEATNNTIKYFVKDGDTLWSIATAFETSVDEIKQLNNLSSSLIYVGQELLIAGSENEEENIAIPENNLIEYEVKSGDTLYKIALNHDTTVEMIRILNGLSNDVISVGQVLIIENNNQTNLTEDNNPTGLMVTVLRYDGSIVTETMENYVIGVVASEMPASFSTEALKAQSIAARTYAISRVEKGEILSDTDHHQVYSDVDELKKMWGSSFDYYYNKIKEIVYSTAGEVAVYNNQYIDALYYSTNNGYTQSAVDVWGGNLPYLQKVDSHWDLKSPEYSSTTTMSIESFKATLGITERDINIEILERNTSNYITSIKVNGTVYGGNNFRSKFRLRSMDFEINILGDTVSITTKGFGHSVGMSQYGAHFMGLEGYTYDQILKHYYLGIDIVSIEK